MPCATPGSSWFGNQWVLLTIMPRPFSVSNRELGDPRGASSVPMVAGRGTNGKVARGSRKLSEHEAGNRPGHGVGTRWWCRKPVGVFVRKVEAFTDGVVGREEHGGRPARRGPPGRGDASARPGGMRVAAADGGDHGACAAGVEAPAVVAALQTCRRRRCPPESGASRCGHTDSSNATRAWSAPLGPGARQRADAHEHPRFRRAATPCTGVAADLVARGDDVPTRVGAQDGCSPNVGGGCHDGASTSFGVEHGQLGPRTPAAQRHLVGRVEPGRVHPVEAPWFFATSGG